MKTLFINRHAKSSWKDYSLKDFDRPLNKRGKLNAAFMAEMFASEYSIDLIISSPAKRARKTAEYFATAQGISTESIQFNEIIYGASISEMMTLLQDIPSSINKVMIFGHNPTFNDLAEYLDHNFMDHLVTCARVQIEFDIDNWKLLSKNLGRTIAHHYPRMYPEMENL
ncbi:MAG: histidine phosphatase family protein [Bacteroidota bacterium]